MHYDNTSKDELLFLRVSILRLTPIFHICNSGYSSLYKEEYRIVISRAIYHISYCRNTSILSMISYRYFRCSRTRVQTVRALVLRRPTWTSAEFLEQLVRLVPFHELSRVYYSLKTKVFFKQRYYVLIYFKIPWLWCIYTGS